MINSRLMNILRAPVVGEKSMSCAAQNCVIFKVLPDATKAEIKAAVELNFGVKVVSVRTLNVLGKKRRTAHGFGVRSNWKKAYVTLDQGQSIDMGLTGADIKESN